MTEKDKTIESLNSHARHMRELSLQMAYNCGTTSHLGGGLSIIDALAVLYGYVMNTSEHGIVYQNKDKFILSKGHGVLGYYAALIEFGLLNLEEKDTFLADGSDLVAHPVMNLDKGIEASTGSLGQGVSLSVGIALAAQKKGYNYKTYVICGNGECNEGSVWEACMSAVNYELDNFTLFIDNNSMQSDGKSDQIMNVSDRYEGMLDALGFQVITIDGNDIQQLCEAFDKDVIKGKPKAIIGNTIKGKGVSFMENNPDWHHNRLTKEQFDIALAEIKND